MIWFMKYTYLDHTLNVVTQEMILVGGSAIRH